MLSAENRVLAEEKLQEYLADKRFKNQFPPEYYAKWMLVRIENTFVPGGTLVDLGGGYSIANAVLADMGMTVYCVDLMSDYFEHSTMANRMDAQFEFLKEKGVRFINTDLLTYNFSDFADQSVDAVGSYHTFEHLHHSPRKICDQIMRILKPSGIFFLEVPNAVNLLKRLKALFGKSNYPPYKGFFESEQWVGHVREYTVEDVMFLVKHYGLKNPKLFGLNYYGTLYSKFGYGLLSTILDHGLRLRPGLCGALYLKATR